MEIHRIFIWLCFFFCLAFAAGGLLVFFRTKEMKGFAPFRFLQYSVILFYTFGFYSLWSGILFRLLFLNFLQNDNMTSLSGYVTLIGAPFLLCGMVTFILWAISLSGKMRGPLFLSLLFLTILLIVWSYFIYFHFTLLVNSSQLYAILILTVDLFVMILIGGSKTNYLTARAKGIIMALICISALINIPFTFNSNGGLVFQLLFIFIFFMVNTVLGIYFVYQAKFTPNMLEEARIVSFKGIIKKYSLTPRESEIVLELYQGKTNQEVADKLFVTLQTIKDHTHRIYQKTDVKNRAQLTNLLHQFEQKNNFNI